jgi:hypothetical protein
MRLKQLSKAKPTPPRSATKKIPKPAPPEPKRWCRPATISSSRDVAPVPSQTDPFRPPDPPRNSPQTHSPSSDSSHSSCCSGHCSGADDDSTDSVLMPCLVTARQHSLSSATDASNLSQRPSDFTEGSDSHDDSYPVVGPCLASGRLAPSPSTAHPSDASSTSSTSSTSPPSSIRPIRPTKSELSQRHPIHSVTFSTTPTSSGALGNQQHQVLESWGALFSKLNPPCSHALEPLPLQSNIPPNGSHKRCRQQRITPVGHDRNAPHGDAMQVKSAGLSRFYFVNPNGISCNRNLLDFCDILQNFLDNDIDVCGLSEINLDTLQLSLRKQLEDMSQAFSALPLSLLPPVISDLRPHANQAALSLVS